MTWFRVDDKFAHHMKVERLRAACESDALFTAAITVWTLMGSDCAGRNPDGSFTEFRMRQVVPISQAVAVKACAKLREAGLFDEVESGHRFHDFGVYNETPEEAAEKKAKREELAAIRRAAGSKGGKQSQANRQANGKQVLEQTDQAKSEQVLQATLARAPAGTGTGMDRDLDSSGTVEHPNRIPGDVLANALWSACPEWPKRHTAGDLIALAELAESFRPDPLTEADFTRIGKARMACRVLPWFPHSTADHKRPPTIAELVANDGKHLRAALTDAMAWTPPADKPPPPKRPPLLRPDETPLTGPDLAESLRKAREGLRNAG